MCRWLPCMRKRRLGLVAYFLALALMVFAAYRWGDPALGWVFPISPWPPIQVNNALLFEETVQYYDFVYTSRTNSKGLRGDGIPPKSKDVFRVLVIGGSYVYGWGVNREDTWEQRLEALLRDAGHKVEIINGGMPGNGPIEYAQRAQYLIPDLQPDLVLVCFTGGSDIGDTPTDMILFTNFRMLMRDWKFRKAPDIPKEWRISTVEGTNSFFKDIARMEYDALPPERREKFEKLEDVVKENFFEGRVNPWMVANSTKWPHVFEEQMDDTIPLMETKKRIIATLMRRVRRIASRHNARVLAIVLPEGPFVNREALKNWSRLGFVLPPEMYGNQGPERTITAACTRAGLNVLDLQPAFREHGDETGLFFKLDTHMSPAGHKLLAEIMAPLLAKEIP